MGIELKASQSRPQPLLCLRLRRRPSLTSVLLLLAGAFSLRGWRAATLIDLPVDTSRRSRYGAFPRLQDGRLANGESHCEWRQNDPLLYTLQHSRLHDNAQHWSHVAGCFIGRRTEFREYIALSSAGPDIYIKDADPAWSAKLVPMTRLLIVAAITAVGVGRVHFLDGNHASFSFPTSGSSAAPGTGGVRGGLRARAGTAPPEEELRRGQVGVLELDRYARDKQFVVSAEQAMPDRLVVSATTAPSRSLGASRGEAAGRREGGQRPDGTGLGVQESGNICVKFAAKLETGGEKRDSWFRGPEDVRDFLRAVDNYCPISWLRNEDAQARAGDRNGNIDGARGGAGGQMEGGAQGVGRWVAHGAAGGGGKGTGRDAFESRKVLIYQRDLHRKLLKSDQVATELWERMSNLGWSITEIVHDEQRHPCDVIRDAAGADVLLTPHGFQSTLSLFMRPGSVLFEVYPYKYYKPAYAPPAEALGMWYAYSISPPTRALTRWSFPTTEVCMQWSWCRKYVGGANVELTQDNIEVLISLMLKSENLR